MVTVLFVCVHNAGRSQMSEALFNHISNGRHKGLSAGSQPSESLNPVVIEAMKELNIDISKNQPKKLTRNMILEADLVITMGCGEDACPVVPNEFREWKIEDPKGKSLHEVRVIRDNLNLKIIDLINELGNQEYKDVK